MSSNTTEALVNLPTHLRAYVIDWLRLDKNSETREEILQLCHNEDWGELETRFAGRVQFGTAGLRARMEAGTSRLNSLIILQATQGLAKYIEEQFPENKVAVVGHDHRFHSKEFAIVTAAIFLRAGFKVYYLNPGDSFVHTPLVPFTVDHLKASVGVMITASHNPKMDNGYKVYYNNGCQIIPPHDKNIATLIDKNLEPWSNDWNWDLDFITGEKNSSLVYIKEAMTVLYKDICKHLIETPRDMGSLEKKPWFVYTPMHGVGYEIFSKLAKEVMNLEENSDYITVAEQKYPDPSFPTVNFPNPEEKGALNLAITLAEKHNILLVIANDPDADRFSLAIKDQASKQWRQLNGNEIGFLFAYHELEKYKNRDQHFKSKYPLGLLNSTVSSQMIKSMAEVENFKYEDTLTGFKWIGNRARQLETEGYYVPFGYEEAIGYMFPELVHDKDGIGASLMFLEAYIRWLLNEKKRPLDILELGYKKYGFFKEYNGYYILRDSSIMKTIFEYARYDYQPTERYPKHIGSQFQVNAFRDLTVGFQSDTVDNKPDLPIDPNSQMITILMEPTKKDFMREYVRFTMRGSGTEPKLKVYIEAHSNTETRANELAKLTWDVLREEWFRPDETGLTTIF